MLIAKYNVFSNFEASETLGRVFNLRIVTDIFFTSILMNRHIDENSRDVKTYLKKKTLRRFEREEAQFLKKSYEYRFLTAPLLISNFFK